MAYRIVGVPDTVTIDGDVLTWSQGAYDRENFEMFGVGDYVYNVTDDDASLITSVSGYQTDGSYKITVTSGHGWTGTPACTPQGSNDKLTYSTLSTAYTASSDGDNILVWAEAAGGRTRYESIGTTTTLANIYGMRPGLNFLCNTIQWINFSGDLSPTTVTVSNITLRGVRNGACYGIEGHDTGAPPEFSLVIDRVQFVGLTRGGNIGAVVDLTIKNCLMSGLLYGYLLNHSATGTISIINNTVLNCYAGFYCYDLAVVSWNNICIDTLYGFANTTLTTGGYNATSDTSAPGSSALVNQDYDDFSIALDNSRGLNIRWADITEDSSCYHTGTPIAGINYDLCGRERDAANPSRGCFEGSWFISIDKDQILESDDGDYHEAQASEVQNEINFGPSQTYTGTYTGTIPTSGDITITETDISIYPGEEVYLIGGIRFTTTESVGLEVKVQKYVAGAWTDQSTIYSDTFGVVAENTYTFTAINGGSNMTYTPPTEGQYRWIYTVTQESGTEWTQATYFEAVVFDSDLSTAASGKE